MNGAEKMIMEARLMKRIADWMEAHGEVLSVKEYSNDYTGVRVREIRWQGHIYEIVDVDWMTCKIERQ